jgi:hypothetical protein
MAIKISLQIVAYGLSVLNLSVSFNWLIVALVCGPIELFVLFIVRRPLSHIQYRKNLAIKWLRWLPAFVLLFVCFYLFACVCLNCFLY